MKEFIQEQIDLKVYGKDVKLTRPTWGQLKRFKSEAKSAIEKNGDDLEAVEKLFVACGLPQDVLDMMDLQHVKALQELLIDSKKN